MLKKVVHLFFIIIGGTIGFVYGPSIMKWLDIPGVSWLASPYVSSIVGALLMFLITYFIVDYIVDFLRWVEEGLIKIPVGDLFFGSLGLTVGLVIAYLINIPIKDIHIDVVS